MRLWKSGPIVPFTNSPQGENSKSYAMALPHSAMHPEHPAPTALKGSKVRAGFSLQGQEPGGSHQGLLGRYELCTFPALDITGPASPLCQDFEEGAVTG